MVKPTQDAAAYAKNDQAKSALKNGQVDAIVVDLPTAFYITAAEVTDATIVGQFENQGGTPEQFGLVLDKGSALTACVTDAVDALREDGLAHVVVAGREVHGLLALVADRHLVDVEVEGLLARARRPC